MTQAYPLQWPAGWPRARSRKVAPFKVPPQQARREMLEELSRLGARDVIVSTDQPLNRDGSTSLVRRYIADPGVAVYFKRKGRDVVLACDQYGEIHDNMRAIGKTAEAMRGIERWGASDMLDRAFTGFEALPAPEQWWQVLGLGEHATLDQIKAAYRSLAAKAHPDQGGSDAAMARLNAARDAALRVIA
ncbi:J domain-containing protein [Sphingomonas koreensis]